MQVRALQDRSVRPAMTTVRIRAEKCGLRPYMFEDCFQGLRGKFEQIEPLGL